MMHLDCKQLEVEYKELFLICKQIVMLLIFIKLELNFYHFHEIEDKTNIFYIYISLIFKYFVCIRVVIAFSYFL